MYNATTLNVTTYSYTLDARRDSGGEELRTVLLESPLNATNVTVTVMAGPGVLPANVTVSPSCALLSNASAGAQGTLMTYRCGELLLNRDTAYAFTWTASASGAGAGGGGRLAGARCASVVGVLLVPGS